MNGEHVGAAREVVERLRRQRGVAAHERQRGRALERSLSASAPALSAARSVSEFLTTANVASTVAELRAQVGDLRHGIPR